MEKLINTLEEMKETQDHFLNKFELIWQKFTNLQEKFKAIQLNYCRNIWTS